MLKISKSDSDKMRRLAQEGKQISTIVEEDFPSLDYWEVYFEVHNNGQRSAHGIKRMITNRLQAVATSTDKAERTVIVSELQDLVWHLYTNYKISREKLAAIRATLGE